MVVQACRNLETLAGTPSKTGDTYFTIFHIVFHYLILLNPVYRAWKVDKWRIRQVLVATDVAARGLDLPGRPRLK